MVPDKCGDGENHSKASCKYHHSNTHSHFPICLIFVLMFDTRAASMRNWEAEPNKQTKFFCSSSKRHPPLLLCHSTIILKPDI